MKKIELKLTLFAPDWMDEQEVVDSIKSDAATILDAEITEN